MSNLITCGAVQDQGTAIWLFAYFGYWLQVWFVILVKAITGSLMTAGVKRRQLKTPAKGQGHETKLNSLVANDEKGVHGAEPPLGKDVRPADFIVHPNSAQKTNGKLAHEDEAEGSGSSGSDQQHGVQMANIQH